MFRRLLAVLTLTIVAFTTAGVTAIAAHADTTYSGEGDQVIRIRATKKSGLISLTHDGESNFAVWAISPNGKKQDLLVNEIGPYTGTVLYNGGYTTTTTAAIQIEADGDWTATFKPITKARCWCSATIRGTGDQVLKLSPTKGLRTLRAAHNGESNFVVQSYTSVGGSPDLLINQIGRYRGRVLLPAGTRLVTVQADGTWTLRRN